MVKSIWWEQLDPDCYMLCSYTGIIAHIIKNDRGFFKVSNAPDHLRDVGFEREYAMQLCEGWNTK